MISQRIRAFLWIFSYIKNYNKIFSKEKTSEVCPSANSHYLLQLFHLNYSVFTLQGLNYIVYAKLTHAKNTDRGLSNKPNNLFNNLINSPCIRSSFENI